MARRKANVSPRVRPAEALKAIQVDPASVLAREGSTGRSPPTSGGVVEPEGDPAEELPEAAGGTVDDQPVDPPQEPAEPPEPEPEIEPVLGEMMSTRILKNVFQTPVIPDGLMSDDPFPGQTPDDGDRALAQDLSQTRGAPAPDYAPVAAPARPSHVPAIAAAPDRAHEPVARTADPRPGVVSYVQRVTVTEAYQFNGRVQSAPEFVDRNWLSFDEVSKEETGVGIVLELPGIGICRIGDYIVRQSVLMDDTGYSIDRVAVYSKDNFEKMFLPVVS
jgi:hypothetical protein